MELSLYNSEIISVATVSIFMAISPGADFVMIMRNAVFYNRKAGIYSAIGVSLAIWLHVAYSIAGMAIIISKSLVMFSIIKYMGAAYLIYIGWKTFRSNSKLDISGNKPSKGLSDFGAFKSGFVTNALNPKTTIFFMSIFTQVVTPNTPVSIQLMYGGIISIAHLIWFSLVAFLLTQPILFNQFNIYKRTIEKVVGSVLIAFGLKVATATSN